MQKGVFGDLFSPEVPMMLLEVVGIAVEEVQSTAVDECETAVVLFQEVKKGKATDTGGHRSSLTSWTKKTAW